MGWVIDRFEVMVEPALHVQRLPWGGGPGKSECLVFVDLPAKIAGQIGVGPTRELYRQMSIGCQRAKNIGAEDSLSDVNADVAVRQFEGAGEIGDIQCRLRIKEPQDQGRIELIHTDLQILVYSNKPSLTHALSPRGLRRPGSNAGRRG